MMYTDIPYANTVRSVSMMQKYSKQEKVKSGIRKEIVDEISKEANDGSLQAMLIPNEYRRDTAIYKLFAWYDTYKSVLDDFIAKGYRVSYHNGVENKLCGGIDSPPYILIEWFDTEVNLEKGDDK
ncbi:hypothetical protein DIRTYBETTY_220 [Bacillus phage DirtyBetty]|uniref:Uncharacterized protein n=1 Tax=Bacillus phage DirtyBetty TaxID=1873999 RepID=A0A1B1PAQ9_9CAUD|nr:hypothetical protein BIZ88_gp220 [Bacillus phage DirtyBetty]ANT41256.1 hypothetical protein DIRTYBETTY_220 [Bacillus phage DirtyBetty]